MDILRFATAGSVDDGKSTLIGRLLYDTKTVFQDQMDAVERVSKDRGEEYVNLALLTDGLRAEREQGITIDVAYRYFATPTRKFIIADTPGHIQYTRNMVTGASTADLALILVDARKGLVEQSRRHAFLATLLQVPHLVLVVNKMDLVDYSQEVYERIHAEFTNFATKLRVRDLQVIPVSALQGDNVVTRSETMPWYDGPSLLHHLEHVHVASDRNLVDVRFPVQYVIRPMSEEYHDYRGYAGQVAGGVLKKGDEVMVLPSGFTSTIAAVEDADGPIDEAYANVVLRILERYGKLLGPDELKALAKDDPNLPPPAAMARWAASFEAPHADEGFSAVEAIPFVRRVDPQVTGKGLLLDVDGTLRKTRSGEIFPRDPDDVELLPGRREVLKRWVDEGYRLFFVSNQSGVASETVTRAAVDACFARTVELLGLPVAEVAYCPHPAFPAGCFCRKPLPGLGVALIQRHQLAREHMWMVGDMDSDRDFARALGVRYVDAEVFFADGSRTGPGEAGV